MTETPVKPLIIKARFLGSSEINLNDCPVGGFTTQKAKALFAYLVLENDRTHARGTLAALFWPDVPEQTALHNLRQALSTIRKSLDNCGGCGTIFCADRDSISFQSDVKFQVDALEFESHMRALLERHSGSPDRGFPIHLLSRLLEQYKGELLVSVSLPDADLFEDWLVLKRESLNRLAAELLVKLAPWDEDAHSRLIRVLLQLSQGNAALAHYNSAARYIRDDLALEPGRQMHKALTDINNYVDTGEIERVGTLAPINIPMYATLFIGRVRELEMLEDWVSNPACRIITITGPGGSGKTRLAAKLAESQQTLFKDGVFFISIAGCLNINQLSSIILGSVGTVTERSTDALDELLQWSCNRYSLLVLDNVDSCGEAALLAARLTESAPNLTFVFTSYTRLDLVGEKVFPLGGLSTSSADLKDSLSDAARLFYAHLQVESQPEIEHPEFAQNVSLICELVEGLPLAIDLAAGQAKRMSITDLLGELQQNLDVLRSQSVNLPERHRSIQASFENAWRHLSDMQRKSLSVLTSFQSPFTPQAAHQICGVSPADLRDLAGQSLLTWDAHERYRFHRVIGIYAHEKITLSKEESEQISSQHANWFLDQLLRYFSDRSGERFSIFLINVASVLPDILKCLNWLILIHDWQRVQQIILPLYTYYEGRSLFREGSALFANLAHACDVEENSLICRVMFSSRAALLMVRIQQFSKAMELIEFALANAKAKNWQDEIAFSLNAMSNHALVCKNSSTAEEYAREALNLSREIHNAEEEARALYNLGYAETNKGDITKAAEDLTLCRSLSEEQKNWGRLSNVLNRLADVASYRGDFNQSLQYYDEALKIARAMENRFSESLITNNIGTAYVELKQYSSAEEYYKKSLTVCREIRDYEGEAIALSNLGELAMAIKDFKKSVEYNQLALEISKEIESDLGERSARIILAESYRELGDKKAAENEVILLLEMAEQTESRNFFHRGVVEACHLLMESGFVESLADILNATIQSEGAEESTRIKAQTLLGQLPPDKQNEQKMDSKHMTEFLKNQLKKT
ncbi:MAG: SARP family transcriptional regulator [Chloroflexi bacterium]|nr:MAG: SARP family transcriptional regulator [Chloroflexota bacterium]